MDTLTAKPRSVNTEGYYIDYRFIPGAIGDGGSLDNGASMREARRTRKAALAQFEALRADPRIQWVTVQSRHGDKLGSHQAPGQKSWADAR